jgi:hypothetical protein
MCKITLYKKMDEKQPMKFAGNSQEEVLGRIKAWITHNKQVDVNGLTIICKKRGSMVLFNDPDFKEDWYIGPLRIEDGKDIRFASFKDALNEFLRIIKEYVLTEEFPYIETIQTDSETTDVYTADPCPALE